MTSSNLAKKAKPTVPSPARTGALEAVGLRNSWYRDQFRMLAGALPILAGALLVSVVGNIWQATHQAEPRYFAVEPGGRYAPVVPLNSPMINSQQLLQWATKAVSQAFTMDADNYRSVMETMRTYFTEEGYKQYEAAMTDSGTLELVTSKVLMANAVPKSTPVITKEGELNGIHLWKVKLPLQVTFRNSKESASRTYLVTVTIARRSTLETPEGVGIVQFIAQPQ